MEQNRDDYMSWTEKDVNGPRLMTNDELQCRNCAYRTDPSVMECVIYKEKPGFVICGTKPCEDYKKRED